MDEKTRLLICLGAATAANCIPCFEHFFYESRSRGLAPDEIREALDRTDKVNRGAHMAVKNSILPLLPQPLPGPLPGGEEICPGRKPDRGAAA